MFWAGVGVGMLISSLMTAFIMVLCMMAGRGDNDGDN